MPASDFRNRVTFANRVQLTDAMGGTVGEWQDQFTVAARIMPRLGGETVEAARLAGRQPVVIRVRQSTQTRRIATDWRATDARSGVAYNIRTAIDPDMGNSDHGRWIDMLAEAGVAV